jgi:hypothetical protein
MSSQQLSAFAMDIEYYLGQTGFLRHRKTTKTGQSDCAMILTFDAEEQARTAQEVLHEIRRVWDSAPLGYGEDRLSEEILLDSAILKFWTKSPQSGLQATGQIVVNLSSQKGS